MEQANQHGRAMQARQDEQARPLAPGKASKPLYWLHRALSRLWLTHPPRLRWCRLSRPSTPIIWPVGSFRWWMTLWNQFAFTRTDDRKSLIGVMMVLKIRHTKTDRWSSYSRGCQWLAWLVRRHRWPEQLVQGRGRARRNKEDRHKDRARSPEEEDKARSRGVEG